MALFRVLFRTALLLALLPASSATATEATGSASGLPVPRFVSLKTDKVAMRMGPTKEHEIKWIYQRAGLPVEITAEFENWRRIRDADGADGWVYHSLLSGRRNGVVTARGKDDLIPLRASAERSASVVAQLSPGVQGTVKRCEKGWCRISGAGYDGWIEQERLWGVYPNEKVE